MPTTGSSELEGNVAVPRAAYADDHSIAEARTGAIGGLAYIGAVAAAGVVVASGGGLAAAIAGAAIAGGGGGLLGSIAAHFIGQAHAENLQAQLDKGGLLLWVRTAMPTRRSARSRSCANTVARTSTSTRCRSPRIPTPTR